MEDVLTKTFEFMSFPKPIKKPKKTMIDYANLKKLKAQGHITRDELDILIRHKKLIRRAIPEKSKRKRLPSIKSIKDKANTLFSNFIKNRDNRTCVLCKSTINPTAGHLIKRGKMATKFDENNVFCLCSICNFKDWKTDAYHDVYVAWFIQKYGASKYIVLVDKSKEIKQMKRLDYELLIKKYGHMAKP